MDELDQVILSSDSSSSDNVSVIYKMLQVLQKFSKNVFYLPPNYFLDGTKILNKFYKFFTKDLASSCWVLGWGLRWVLLDPFVYAEKSWAFLYIF